MYDYRKESEVLVSDEVVLPEEAAYRPKTKIYAHLLTFPEFINHLGMAVIDLQGNLIGGPDRKFDTLAEKWVAWQKAVKFAATKPSQVPGRVMEFFQKTKHLARPPKPSDLNILGIAPIEDALIVVDNAGETRQAVMIGDELMDKQLVDVMDAFEDIDQTPFQNEIEEPTNMFTALSPARSPRFTWSYTALQEFLTCPASWAAKRFYKLFKEGETDAMRVGNLIHATAEHYLRRALGMSFKESEISPVYLPMVQKYCDALLASGAELYPEREICFTNKFKPCGWKDWDTVWVRSKVDVTAKKGLRLSILDWKSGKFKEDFLQLKMFAVFCALTPGFEDVQEFDPKFIFLKETDPKKNILRLAQPIQRSELKGILQEIMVVVRRMEEAWVSENFPCKKNGLCRQYCLNHLCPHCGIRR